MAVLMRSGAPGLSRAALCAVFLIPAVANADTILLTGGAVEVIGRDVTFSLDGDDFTFRGGADLSGGFFAPANCVFPECAHGTAVSLAATWAGNDLPGTATYRGATYRHVGSLGDDAAQLSIELRGSFVVPPGGGLVEAPFALDGLFLYPSGALNHLTSVTLAGSGVTSIWLDELNDAPGFFFGSRVRYDLAPAVPTPEPGSLALLLGGAAWAASRRRYLRR